MRGQVVLDEVSGDIWPDTFNLQSLKSATKLSCLLEVIGTGGIQPSALSCNSKFLAVVTQGEDGSNRLFIIHHEEKRFYLLKRMAKPCTALVFHPYMENMLFLATAATKIYRINADDGSVVVMEGHTSPAKGIHSGSRSPLVLSYNTDEVFLWSWPSLTLTNKLRLEDRVAVVWAGHVWQRDELVVCFINGSLLLWPSQDLSTQRTIEPPSGLDFDFTAFTLSSGGEWIVGGGKSHLMVTYSLVGRRVSQVVQLPSSCNSVYQVIFLPPVHPRFCQVLAILNTTGVLNIIDFTSMTKIKTVRSQRFNIDSVSVSEDGNFLAVSYANSITKVYPVNALFPEDPKNVELRNIKKRDVEFKIIEKMEVPERKEEEGEKDKRKREKHKELKELLDRNKWYPILVEFKSYPEKYRSLIWVSMLELPRNYLVFSTLLDKGMHSAFEGLKEVLKLSDGSLLKTLQGTLSCLAHWAPFLSSIEYLPELIFPFVKFFHSNRLLCFEVAVTFIMNWCRLWFEFWPKPSVTVLTVIERLICENDPVLLAHLMKLQVTAEDYAWSLLTNAFSRVLSNEDWVVLWDHIFSNPPSFLPCAAAAFTIKSRHTLLTCEDAQDVKTYYSQEAWISVKHIIDKAYFIYQNTSAETLPKELFGELKPMPKGGLPIFNIGPRDAREEERGNVERKLRNLSLRTEALKHKQSKATEDTSRLAEKEEMVYTIGRKDLEKQEEECLNSILNLRKRHLATAELDAS